MKTLIIEGVRGYEASFSLIAMHLALHLSGRSGLTVYFRDVPPWGQTWTPLRGVLSPEDEARVMALPAPPDGLVADALLRIEFPMRCRASEHRATFVYGLAEFYAVEPLKVGGADADVRAALSAPGVTLLTSSRWSLDGFLRSGADPAAVRLATLGYDPAVFAPAPPARRAALRRALGWHDDVVLLNVGTMQWSKGVQPLLLAFAEVLRHFPRARLVLKGGDAIWASAQNLMQQLDRLPADQQARVDARVTYVGQSLPTAALAELYQAADAYVSPYMAEGFNLPVLEAAACGLPIICTAGGPTDDFTHASFAARIPARLQENPQVTAGLNCDARLLVVDLSQLTQTMLACCGDAAGRARAGPQAAAYVRERFTWAHAAEQFARAMGLP